MNWWVILAGVAYIGATTQGVMHGKLWFAGMYFCYFLANVCILMADANTK